MINFHLSTISFSTRYSSSLCYTVVMFFFTLRLLFPSLPPTVTYVNRGSSLPSNSITPSSSTTPGGDSPCLVDSRVVCDERMVSAV